MNENAFWDIIDSSRHAPWDDNLRIASLTSVLRSRDAGEVTDFYRHLLRAAAGACQGEILDAYRVVSRLGHVGDDGFRDFAFWLVLQGHTNYSRVLRDPDELAAIGDVVVLGCARIDAAVEDLVLEQTGRLPSVDVARPIAMDGATRGVSELERRFPRLWARYMAEVPEVPIAMVVSTMNDGSDPLLQTLSAREVFERVGDPSALSVLAGLLNSTDHRVRANAVRFLGGAGAAACKYASNIRGMIHDSHFLVRRSAVQALGDLGPCARSAVDDIRRFAEENDSPDDRYAREAIKRILPGNSDYPSE